jgi:hypothetical protein
MKHSTTLQQAWATSTLLLHQNTSLAYLPRLFRADRVKLCFDAVLKDAGIPTLIMEGYLSPFHHYTIPQWGVQEVAQRYLCEPERWGKSIMYFHRLNHCAEVRDILLKGGVSCAVVSGSSDTDAQIADFYEGKTQVLINCMKLTEGFDCPDLKTVFCRPSCKSITVQMAGRVLRKHKDHPVKQIVQCEKTPYVFTKTALATLQHILINDSWRTLQVNPHIDAVNRRCILALARIETEMPKFITDANKSGRRWGRRAQRMQDGRPLQEDGSFAGPSPDMYHHN